MSTVAIVNNYDPSPAARPATTSLSATADGGSPWGPLVAFLLGFGSRLQVQFIGYLPLSEIAILLLFPALFSNYLRADVRRRAGWLVPLLLLWFVGAIVSDLYRQTEWALTARGFGRLVVFLAAVPFAAWFLATDRYRKLTYFAFGIIPSSILSAFVLRGGVHEGRELVYGKAVISWRTHWGFVFWLVGLFLILYFYRRSRKVAYLCTIVVGAINMLFGARSTGGMSLLAVPVCIAKNWFLQSASREQKRAPLGRSLMVAGFVVAASYGLFSGYSYLAESGSLGGYERARFDLEARSELDPLSSGRLVHIVGGLMAFVESPFIGYGSWPLDKQGFFLRACEFYGVKASYYDYYARGYPLIPSHSCIISAMVEHGILAAPFWIYALFISLRAILKPVGDSRRLQLWVLTTALAMIWNVLFSPIAYRMETSMMLVVFIMEYLDRMHSGPLQTQARRATAGPPAWDAIAAGS